MRESTQISSPLPAAIIAGVLTTVVVALAMERGVSESEAQGWAPIAALAAIPLVLAIGGWLLTRAWQAEHLFPTLHALFEIRTPPQDAPPLPAVERVRVLDQSWLNPGSVCMLAGPGTLPLRRSVQELVDKGFDVWVLGAALGGDRRFGGPGSVRFTTGSASDADQAAWALEVLARGRQPVIVLLPLEGLDTYHLAERVERRLQRFLATLRPSLAAGARLLILWRTEPERLLVPDRVGQRALIDVTHLRLWNGRRAFVPVDPPGLRVVTALSRWLVNPGATLAWNRPNQRVAAFASFVGSALLYTLGALAVCFSVFLGDPREQRLIGATDDSLVGSLWGNWWVGEAISQGRPLDMFYSDLVYWPDGASLITMFGNVLPSLLAQPFQFALGYPGYWNVFVLASLVANGMAMRALARRMGADRTGALIAGAIFAFSPAIVAQVSDGHQMVFQAFGLPLALWAGLGLLDGRQRRSELLTAGCLAIACLGWWIYGAVAWALLLSLGWSRWRYGSPERRAALPLMLGRVIRLWLPTLLFAGPLIAAAVAGKISGLWFGSYPHELPASMLNDITLQTVFDTSVRPASLLLGDPGEPLGWVPTLLGVGVLITWGASPFRSRRFWPLLALLFLVAALGPYIQPSATGTDGWTPLPGAFLFAKLPGFSRIHHPDRLLVIVTFCLAIMVSLSWAWVLRLSWRRGPAIPALAVLFGIAGLPYLAGEAPVAVTSFSVPSFYSVLGDEGAIIEVPIGYREDSLLYQPYHRLPRVGGPGESWRKSNETGEFHLQMIFDPFYRFLLESGAPAPLQGAMVDIRSSGLRYVVVHTGWVKKLGANGMDRRLSSMLQHMERIDSLLGPPIYSSADATIYRMPEDIDNEEMLKQFAEDATMSTNPGQGQGQGFRGGGN